MVCVIYDRNSTCIFIVPILDRQNLRKFEQTFQQCKYNNNNLASIQFRIVYSVSKVRTVGKLFVSSGLHLNRITKTTTSIHQSIYQFVCLFHVYFLVLNNDIIITVFLKQQNLESGLKSNNIIIFKTCHQYQSHRT